MSSINTEKIKTLLGSGLTLEVVASAVGCTASYISQLLADEKFAEDVAALKIRNFTSKTDRDNVIDRLEDKVLEKLEVIIEDPRFFKPNDVFRAFAMINSAKRRGASINPATSAQSNTIVQLNMPTTILNKIVVAPSGEVIEVDGQTVVTITAHDLVNRLQNEASNGQAAAKYSDLAKYIAPKPPEVPSAELLEQLSDRDF